MFVLQACAICFRLLPGYGIGAMPNRMGKTCNSSAICHGRQPRPITELHLLAIEVQLCNLIGHSRPEEGSEHFLAYALEAHPAIGAGHAHGDLVGPAILAIAHLQGQDSEVLQEALLAAQVPLDRVPGMLMEETMRQLPMYVRQHQLPYGIAY
jgi:A-factor biosynthesis hotdog domain